MQIEFFYLKNVKGGIWIEMKSRLPLFVLETFELEILRVESNYRPLSGNAVVRVARVHLLKFAVGVFSLRRTPFQYSSSSGGGKMSGSATLPKRIECVHLCGQFPQEFQSKNGILISGSLCVQLTEKIKWNLEMIEFFFKKMEKINWKFKAKNLGRRINCGWSWNLRLFIESIDWGSRCLADQSVEIIDRIFRRPLLSSLTQTA